MSAENLLSRLERVKRTGAGRWQARCPAHNDKGPSLSVRELDDGRVLVHCFAGCEVHSVLSAVGLSFDDLFPPRELGDHAKREGRPFPAPDILRAIAYEALVVAVAAASMAAGESLALADRDRLLLAVSRIQSALDAGGLRHA
ncbi:DNA primase [Betaproteobacteria bacterium SCN2]|jgi:hypothetical protein|nr:DNA primase [Betaproteobacteria bacterium SCN2]